MIRKSVDQMIGRCTWKTLLMILRVRWPRVKWSVYFRAASRKGDARGRGL